MKRPPSASERFLARVQKAVNRASDGRTFSTAQTRRMLKLVFGELAAMASREKVSWPGLGTFRPGFIAARTVRSPATGEPIRLPRVKKIHFKAAGVLRQPARKTAPSGQNRPAAGRTVKAQGKRPASKPKAPRPVFRRSKG